MRSDIPRAPRIYLNLQQDFVYQPSRGLFCCSIIIIIIIVSFVQGIHTRIPETHHVPRGYIVAAILSLLFVVPLFLVPALALLFFYVSTFRSMCAVPNMAVFRSFLTSWFPGMSVTYFLNDLEMVPVAAIITGIIIIIIANKMCNLFTFLRPPPSHRVFCVSA